MGVELRKSSVSTLSLALPLQGGGNIDGLMGTQNEYNRN